MERSDTRQVRAWTRSTSNGLVEADARRSLARDERRPPPECPTRSPRLWTARSGRDAAARLGAGAVMQGEDVSCAEVDGEPVRVAGVGDGCELVHEPQAEAAECSARSGLGNEAGVGVCRPLAAI